MVKYCKVDCQRAHRAKHKKQCRKRAAELHEEVLFKQPPPVEEDCPICFLRMPTIESGFRYNTCCGKIICSGCIHAPVYDDRGNMIREKKCPLCRLPTAASENEMIDREKKRGEGW